MAKVTGSQRSGDPASQNVPPEPSYSSGTIATHSEQQSPVNQPQSPTVTDAHPQSLISNRQFSAEHEKQVQADSSSTPLAPTPKPRTRGTAINNQTPKKTQEQESAESTVSYVSAMSV